MADNNTLPATGDVIRSEDRAGVKTQVVILDVGGTGAENIPSGAIPVTLPAPSSTGTQSSVGATVTAGGATILAANAARDGATIWNDSTASLYLLLSTATISATLATVKVPPGGYYEVPSGYTGIIKGLWTAVNGSARVTEFT